MRRLSIKKAGAACLAVLTAAAVMAGCGAGGGEAAKNTKTKVVLNEVAHSIFYAPMYVAIEEGYFEEA